MSGAAHTRGRIVVKKASLAERDVEHPQSGELLLSRRDGKSLALEMREIRSKVMRLGSTKIGKAFPSAPRREARDGSKVRAARVVVGERRLEEVEQNVACSARARSPSGIENQLKQSANVSTRRGDADRTNMGDLRVSIVAFYGHQEALYCETLGIHACENLILTVVGTIHWQPYPPNLHHSAAARRYRAASPFVHFPWRSFIQCSRR
jgi:hypothetical protein